jgi:hypothetical protein
LVTANRGDAGQGVWQYSTTAASWTPIPDVIRRERLLIAATDMIRFEPASNFNGTPGSLTVHLVDDSAGAIHDRAIANVGRHSAARRATARTASPSARPSIR